MVSQYLIELSRPTRRQASHLALSVEIHSPVLVWELGILVTADERNREVAARRLPIDVIRVKLCETGRSFT